MTGTAEVHKRIVVADDDADMRASMAEALRDDGYEILEAEDGGRLLVCVAHEREHPSAHLDLVVSDVRMPVCSGLQILKALRESRRKTPVILVTGFHDENTRAVAQTFGARVLPKPVDLDALRSAVAEMLA